MLATSDKGLLHAGSNCKMKSGKGLAGKIEVWKVVIGKKMWRRIEASEQKIFAKIFFGTKTNVYPRLLPYKRCCHKHILQGDKAI